MQHTGVKATAEELEELKTLHKEAQDARVMYFGNNPVSWADAAWERLHKRVHAMALTHGLPDIKGYYGCSLQDGEFVK